MNISEPQKIKLNPDNPIHKDVKKIPLPPIDNKEIDYYDTYIKSKDNILQNKKD